MESPELSFTLAYIVFSFCFVFTPNEFRSAGLTIQNLFSSWLGSEDVGFSQYHVRRTSITVLVHSALPLGKIGHLDRYKDGEGEKSTGRTVSLGGGYTTYTLHLASIWGCSLLHFKSNVCIDNTIKTAENVLRVCTVHFWFHVCVWGRMAVVDVQ